MDKENFIYQCGVIDAFNEVVASGVKQLAISHPTSKEMRDALLPFSKEITKKYNTKYYVEDSLLITDLFKTSANVEKYNILYYQDESVIKQYLTLKKEKQELVCNHEYHGEQRYRIAVEFGKLLSYSIEAIDSYIQNNTEKE